MKYLVLSIFLLTGCIEAEGKHEVIVPDLPCINGWQYDFFGQLVLDPYGGAIQCT